MASDGIQEKLITEIVTAEETVGASMGLSASVEISTRKSSRPLAMLRFGTVRRVLEELRRSEF